MNRNQHRIQHQLYVYVYTVVLIRTPKNIETAINVWIQNKKNCELYTNSNPIELNHTQICDMPPKSLNRIH